MYNSVTNYFLVNLSVADLLVTMICMPMAMSQNITVIWFYGLFMCKFVTYLQGKKITIGFLKLLLFRTYFGLKAKITKKSNVDTRFVRICLRMHFWLEISKFGSLGAKGSRSANTNLQVLCKFREKQWTLLAFFHLFSEAFLLFFGRNRSFCVVMCSSSIRLKRKPKKIRPLIENPTQNVTSLIKEPD